MQQFTAVRVLLGNIWLLIWISSEQQLGFSSSMLGVLQEIST